MGLEVGRLLVAIVPWAWRFWWWTKGETATVVGLGPLYIEWARR